MSKITLLAAISAVAVLGACAKHKAPVVEPITQPVYVEPVSTKGGYR